MKILIITYEIADLGGNFVRCFSFAKQLVKLGHQITILCSNKIPALQNLEYYKDGVQIIEIGSLSPKRIRHNGTCPLQIIRRISYINKSKYDVVHGFGHRPSVLLPCLFFKTKFNKPYIPDSSDLCGWGGLASYRGGILGNLTGYFDDLTEKAAYSLSDAVTAISTDLYQKTIRHRGLASKVFKLPVGADTDLIKPLSKLKCRQKHGLEIKIPYVVFIGNAPYDSEFLGNSFVQLCHHNKEVKFLFVGNKMPDFEKVIAQHKLEKRVTNKGFVPHDSIGELLACGDIMLLPYSDRELNRGRYPNKIGDYMAAGRPTVTNPTGDLKTLFSEYDIGLLAQESPKHFAQQINYLLSNKIIAEKIGQNARKVAETKLSWLALSKDLEKIYSQMLKSNK